MLLLVLSVLALVIGAAVYPIIRKFPASLSFFDAFVLISIVGLTLMHLIPHSIENAGIFGVIAVAVGMGVPALLHKVQHHDHHHGDAHHDDAHKEKSGSNLALLLIIFIGIIIHTLLDGIGLSMSAMDDIGQMLGLGVLFHRLPIGIFLSMMLVPRLGMKKTWGVILALATSTCIGFALGHFALPSTGLTLLYLIQGLIAGSLLHVVFHNISVDGRTDAKWPKGLGALAGFTTLAIVEWIAPVHAHAHASMLDIWTNHLFNAAPFWCIATALVAIGYVLKSKMPSIGEKLCSYIDPQPLQSAFGGPIHVFSMAGIALLMSIYTTSSASIWLISTILALVCAKMCLKSLDCCRACRPESLCSREKSFKLWTASSWTLIAVATILASVLPTVVSPITEGIESLPAPFATITLAIATLAILATAIRKRGITLYSAPIAMLAMICLFHETPGAVYASLALGTLLIFLYDFNPRDIASSVEHDHPWKARYAIAASLCLIFACAPAAILPAISDEPLEITRIEPVHEHHEHSHEAAHDHDAKDDEHAEHAREAAHDHDAKDDEHAEHAREAAHDHDAKDDEHTEHARETNHVQDTDEHEEHASGIHAIADKMHDSPLQFAAFILFILTGLYWIMRKGPRHLIEIAQGKHHHQHH